MKFPLSWIKEYIPFDVSAQEIAKLLTSAGLEVDSVTPLETNAKEDFLFEVSLTPNLGHCTSIEGIARELSALLEKPLTIPSSTVRESHDKAEKYISLEVQDPKRCPTYSCRLIRDVKIGPSPEWMRNKLTQSGFRPINNVVDITNYVLLECGQPLHAFDYTRIQDQKIIVRTARNKERFTTLDNKEHSLCEEDLLICDAQQPIALAGIMGGLNSEVSENTSHVLIEAAHFQPTSIRRTSKRLGIQTESSKRFERFVDPHLVERALNRATALLQELALGKISPGMTISNSDYSKLTLSCRLSRVNQLLGTQLGVNEVENILRRLEFNPHWDNTDTFHLQIPTFRADITQEVDIIEEIARIYGYDNIPLATPFYQSSLLPDAPIYTFERETRSRLLAEGLQELLTCDLIGPSLLNITQEACMPEKSTITVLNPTSIEQSVLRTSLLPGLLQVVKYNISHQNHDLSGFEIGHIHFKEKEHYKEQSVVGIIMTGKSQPYHWGRKSENIDFFGLKGVIENLLALMGINNSIFKVNHLPSLHPGRQLAIYVGELEVGSLGEVHPTIVRRLDVPQKIYFAEINLHDLYKIRPEAQKVQALPLFPSSTRDWTVTLNDSISIEKLLEKAHLTGSELLEEITLLDIYQSDTLGKGLRNVTFRFIYRDKEKTILQGTADAEHKRLVDAMAKVVNG